MKMKHVVYFSSVLLPLVVSACSASGPDDSADADSNGDGDKGPGDGDGSGGNNSDLDIDDDSDTGGGSGDQCGQVNVEAELIREPVDIILVLDNSGSMADELEAVEQNINVNFANILEESGVDYRVILISRHRIESREASESASTSICVESPLSGLATCPSPFPILSSKFYQYSIKIESTDSLDRIIETYNLPDDKYDLTLTGWKEWLRPGAKKVFLEMTDDNALMTADTFIGQLTALAPEHFGTPSALNFVFHSIIGIADKTVPSDPYLPEEPIESAICSGNSNVVENSGATFQELSRRTGGLRFPLCEFDSYDVVFKTIAEDVVTQANVACDFEIPPPPSGQKLELDKIAVSHITSDASKQFGQAPTQAACEENAFYIQDSRIWLCPATCDSVRAASAPGSSVEVLFTCESTIIVR